MGIRNFFVDEVIILLMYLQLVILEFFGLGSTLNKVLSILIIFRILFKYRKYVFRQKVTYIAFGCIIIYIIGGLISEEMQLYLLYSNLLNFIYPMVYAFYIYILYECRGELMDKLTPKYLWVFNITMIINLYVIIRQIVNPYSIIAVTNGPEISYYKDLISGLFQYASTHIVCLFTCFVVIYNLSEVKYVHSIMKKILIIIYVCVLIVISAYIAIQNDNKALFLVMSITIMAYLFITEFSHSTLKMITFLGGGLFALSVIIVLYCISPMIQNTLNDNILSIINAITKAFSMGNAANGSAERMAMIGYAFGQKSTFLLGNGFGDTGIFTSGYLGFNHFGQSDLGMMLILGGVWFTGLMVLFYLSIFTHIVAGRGSLTKFQIFCIFILFVFVIIYTQCMTRTNATICMLLIMIAIRNGVVKKYSLQQNAGK